MNEMQIIRRELAAQREHSREIGASWNSRRFDLSIANSVCYNLYFLLIIGLESKRIESHLDRLRSRSDLSDTERRKLERCAREFETLTAARVPASASDPATTITADTVARFSTVVQELEAIAASRYGVDDWRRASYIDADSILEERRLRTQALGEAHGRAPG
jgi:hypothetical protein